MTSTTPRSFDASTSSISGIPRSQIFESIEWIGDTTSSVGPEKGDTFPVAWLADDSLISAAGDPVSHSSPSGLDVRRFIGAPPNFSMEVLNTMSDFVGWGGDGPKPTGMLSHNGTVFLAAQNVPGRHSDDEAVITWGHGYDAHIFASTDGGATWEPSMAQVDEVMFPGRAFGAPTFVSGGRDREHAVDEFVYAISGEGWDNGSRCMLGRVPVGRIQDRSAWEFVSGFDDKDNARWSADLGQAVPVLTHPGYLGTMEMVYLHNLQRYLLLGWTNKVKAQPGAGSELIVYEAPSPAGPFALVHHEDPWESPDMNPYNPRIPLKWFDHDRNEGWLLFSGNWRDEGSSLHYRAHARKFRLRLRDSGTTSAK